MKLTELDVFVLLCSGFVSSLIYLVNVRVFYCSQERPCPSHFSQLCGPCAAHMSVYLPEEVLTSPADMVSSTMKCLSNLIIM